MGAVQTDVQTLNLPNHLILFPKWTQLVIQTGKVAITGKRAADGYIIQLLMNCSASDLPDVTILNLEDTSQGWQNLSITEPTLICNNKEKVMYNPSFVSGELNEVSLYMLYSYINIYSACSLSILS